MIIYLTHLTICWTILFLSYHLFLKKETFFRYNRWYLLMGLILGLFIPLIDWSGWFSHQPESLGQIYVAPIQYQVHQLEVYANSSATSPWWQILLKWIYITGALVAGLKLAKGIQEIISLRRHATIKPKNGYNLVLTQKLHVPFSFMNSVYWSRELYDNSGIDQRILAHEAQHISSLHSLDILFIEILSVVFWFHPLVYLYQKELKEVHEYEADAAACVLGSKKEYGQMLLHQAQSGLQLALANHFFYSQLKNRFKMMTRKPSTRAALLKYLIALPVIGVAAMIFSFSMQETDFSPIPSEDILADTIPSPPLPPPPPPLPPLPEIGEMFQTNQGDFSIKETDILFVNGEEIGQLSNDLIDEYSQKGSWRFTYFFKKAAREKWGDHINGNVYSLTSYDAGESIASHNPEVFRVVEKMPRFPGCDDAGDSETDKKRCADKKMLDFLYSNLRYPDRAVRNGIEGQVVVSFIVEKDGSLSNIKSIRSPDESLSEEAIRMIRLMNEKDEKWIPGEQKGQKVRVEFILPILFNLSEKDIQKEAGSPDLKNKDIKMISKEGLSPAFPPFPGCEGKGLSLDEKSECAYRLMMEYIYHTIKYPAEAREKGIQGDVILTMKISKKGRIDQMNIVEDPGSGLGEEVERVIKSMASMGAWYPARKDGLAAEATLSFPVSFELKGAGAKSYHKSIVPEQALPPAMGKVKVVSYMVDSEETNQNNLINTALIVLDDQILGRSKSEKIMKEIDPSSIESIQVLKGETAIDKYGDQGRHGVIEITSKVPRTFLEKPKLKLSVLNIYPNPVHHELNIDLEGPEGDYRLEIMDISGASLIVKTLYNQGVTQTDINTGDLKAGMYYLIITSGHSTVTRPFVKQ